MLHELLNHCDMLAWAILHGRHFPCEMAELHVCIGFDCA
jgi:hypothetical protein